MHVLMCTPETLHLDPPTMLAAVPGRFQPPYPKHAYRSKRLSNEKLQYTEQSQLQVHISSLHIPNQKHSTLPMNNPKKHPLNYA